MGDPHDGRLALSVVRCKIAHYTRRKRRARRSTGSGKLLMALGTGAYRGRPLPRCATALGSEPQRSA